jgi:hypothetical protein
MFDESLNSGELRRNELIIIKVTVISTNKQCYDTGPKFKTQVEFFIHGWINKLEVL